MAIIIINNSPSQSIFSAVQINGQIGDEYWFWKLWGRNGSFALKVHAAKTGGKGAEEVEVGTYTVDQLQNALQDIADLTGQQVCYDPSPRYGAGRGGQYIPRKTYNTVASPR